MPLIVEAIFPERALIVISYVFAFTIDAFENM